MSPIGGYFGLELRTGSGYPHPAGVHLNSGRNALEYILLALNPRRVYLPFFTCDAVLEPFGKTGVEYVFYHIDGALEIAGDIELAPGEYLLYTNYFGIKGAYVDVLSKCYGDRLIIDQAQALFAPPVRNCFYSPRKFVGVPDGGVVYCKHLHEEVFPEDTSFERCGFLLKRYDLGPEAGYRDFKESSVKLSGQGIHQMSKLTQALLSSIDFESIACKRIENFMFLHRRLSINNALQIPDFEGVPMVYPYLTADGTLRSRLIAERVFVATYWPNVLEWCQVSDVEYKMTKYLIPLPCDQRYGKEEMERILDIIGE